MLRTIPRPYQCEAGDRALAHPGFALFPQQRTGKCLISLYVVDKRKPDVLVIVCPKKAIRVWKEQLKDHLKFDWDCEKVIIHYEGMCRNAKDRRWWRKRFRETWAGKKVFIIVDEGHRIKGRGSLQSSMLRSVGRYCAYRLLLTGTPVDKVREDSWALFDFIQPGALEDTYEEFSDMYLEMESIRLKRSYFKEKPGPRDFYKKVTGYRNNKRFLRIFHKYSYRITLREAQKRSGRRPYIATRRVVGFELKPETRRVYNELLTELKAEVRKKHVSTPLVVTLVSKLQQLTGGFLIHTEQVYGPDDLPVLTPRGKPKIVRTIIPVGREKLIELRKLISRYPRRKKLVICVMYRHEIERIGRQLEKLGRSWKMIAGGQGFDGRFDTDTVVMQIASGEAIDLSKAKNFIMYSWNHSNIKHEQAMFRILAFISTRVNFIYLMADDSVDHDIYAAVTKKIKVTRLVIDKYRYRKRA